MGNFLFFQILYALCCVQVTNAVGTVSPSNATLVAQAGDLVMTYGLQTLAGTTTNSTIVYPLTTSMGLGATLANLRVSLGHRWKPFCALTPQSASSEADYVSGFLRTVILATVC